MKSLLTLFFISVLFLTACHTNRLAAHQQAKATPSAQAFLQLAAMNDGAQKQYYLLQSAETSLSQHQSKQAMETLDQIDQQQLSPQQRILFLIIQAQFALDENQPQTALQYLQQAQASNVLIANDTQVKLQKLVAKAYFAMNRILSGLTYETNAYVMATNDSEKQRILLMLWEKLETLNAEQQQTLFNRASTEIERGWLALTLIAKNLSLRQENLITEIKHWQNEYPNHPAQVLLQNRTTRGLLLSRPAQHIALLLPLTGPLGNQGRAIRNGFLAAYYQTQSSGYSPEITLLDTHQNDVTELYRQALEKNVDVVVGPLLKTDITTLINTQPLTVPTIALNTVAHTNSINNLYFFGLDPDDEVQQVAEKMKSDHKTRVFLITPQDAWGQRIRTFFQSYWKQEGGTISAEVQYQTRAQLANQLRIAFNLEASQQRYLNLRWLLKKKIRFVPRRRQDFDAIFVDASPTMGRQIIPLLRFYYASNVPTYSTSHIYSAQTALRRDRDLDGVIFDDMPWLFANYFNLSPWLTSVQQKILSAWPDSYYAFPRLYALGADAFALIPKITQMSLLPTQGLSSATGELFLEPTGKIYRKLVWAKIHHGTAKPLSS